MRMPLLLAVFCWVTAFPCAAADIALARLEQAASTNLDSNEDWDRYGIGLPRAQRLKEALAAMNLALGNATQDPSQIQHHLALVYAWSGDFADAIQLYEQLVARYPNDSEIRIDYGQTLAWNSRYPEAALQYERVLAREPRNVEALLRLGDLEAWQGHYDLALADVERGLRIDGGNPDLVAERADILSWKGDLAAATEAYETLVKIAPGNAKYWLKLAQVYAWKGRPRQARTTFEKALSLDPYNVDAYLGLATVFRNNHQYEQAEQILRRAMISFPADSRAASELAALAAEKPMSPRAIMELSEPLVGLAIMIILAVHIRNERRVLRRRHLVVRVLLPALPLLGLLAGAVCADVFAAGPYYQDVSAAAQLLNPLLLGALLTLLLVWWLRLERPPRQKTVLAIGAHPDDIEFGCGATMLRLREEGAATYGLVLTGGERGHNESDRHQVRVGEACSAARVMALCDIEVLNFPDTTLHEHKADIRKAIEEALERWRPNIIFTHNAHDVHTDHHTVYEATREAARGAYTILCYENPNTPPGFNPGYFFDVENYIDGKIAALACHKSQMGKSYAASEVVRAMAGFRGTQARVPFAEGFEVMRVLERVPTP